MARIKQRGKAGAAKAYVTRSAAVKKLQCSLADFRRLCILKGIFPREPRHKKKANKGSTAPTSFYYAKDIAYLAHEPVLRKLRDHKAFAKKLARALGRGEWSSAKSLEDNKPVYTLDHIVKERYPTFIDALRDIEDALCLVHLFASLPSDKRLSPSLVANCSRLAMEWQLYIMRTNSLQKVFLSIKGVYFQAEILDQTITWLVPYQFTQNIPTDVDVRVMLTFLELYQTLLGFVMFKLYSDIDLIYPPPLDDEKDAAAAGVGAFNLQDAGSKPTTGQNDAEAENKGSQTTVKNVKQLIKAIGNDTGNADTNDSLAAQARSEETPVDEEFVVHGSKSSPNEAASLPTLHNLSSLPGNATSKLFSPCTFYLSRESSRPLFEFIVRACGGRIGWPPSSGSGSPFDADDSTITHVIMDRPVTDTSTLAEEEKERRRRRKFVQPQWIVDCINAGKLLSEVPYEQGKALPPHLSPFGEAKGSYDPLQQVDDDAMDDDEDDKEFVTQEDIGIVTTDPDQLRAAELEAEARGVDIGAFEKQVQRAKGGAANSKGKADEAEEQSMNKMLMSRKQKTLYEKMKYSENKRDTERQLLEQRKRKIVKEQRKERKTT